MPPPVVTIRIATPADAAAMFTVHRASVQALCASYYSASHIETWFHDRTPQIYQPALEAQQVWLAEESNQIVGFSAAEPGEVTLLFVDPDKSGRGIGKLLFEHALTKAAVNHLAAITVIATLNSVPFYRRYGFEPIADEAFIRGAEGLSYPVKRMIQRPQDKPVHAVANTDA